MIKFRISSTLINFVCFALSCNENREINQIWRWIRKIKFQGGMKLVNPEKIKAPTNSK